MRRGDGLSRKDRIERILSVLPFQAIDNSLESLLHQTEAIASFIRYYNFNNEPEGYFDELLDEIRQLGVEYRTGKQFIPTGDMEPSQALLWVFLQQLHTITERFNKRWKSLPYWYMNELIGIHSLHPVPDKVWVQFRKNIPETTCVEKDECFLTPEDENGFSFCYRLGDNFEVQNITVDKAYSIYFEKQKNMFPASVLNAVTSLKIKNLLAGNSGHGLMFGKERNLLNSHSLGFMIASPAFLLREGKRIVTITFEAENNPITDFIHSQVEKNIADFNFISQENISAQLLNNIFHIRISTVEGWKLVPNYVIRTVDTCKDDLELKFVLSEEFPCTIACDPEIHEFESKEPVVKVLLNLDAWLYPYSWIKNFLLRRIRIHTRVEGVTNLLVYNELGRIDNSKPFQPFGVNTEKGAWFAIGNYEMAVKYTQAIDLKMMWLQLPEDAQGMKGYYDSYRTNIDNTSFKISPRYLSEYNWRPVQDTYTRYLFATRENTKGAPIPNMPLISRNQWNEIPVDKMPPVHQKEEDYDYSIQSKTGFISFMLEEPSIGFGEKKYRQLFTELMIRNSFRKKNQALLNPPITPQIERLTMDYEAEECIDLRARTTAGRNNFYHVFPLGCKSVYPNQDNKSIPLIYTLESDANLLLALKQVQGGEFLRLYLDFIPVNKEIADLEIPQLKWYYGDGYTWYLMPDGTILNDTTRNLLVGGCIEFNLPEAINRLHLSSDGIVWIRAGIDDNYEYIPSLAGIYTNAAELILEIRNPDDDRWYDYKVQQGKKLIPARSIPGITQVQLISSFYGGREKETDLNKLIRVSEYVSHRGKAVIPRDYERIILQRFPEVEKVKCIPALDTKQGRSGVVTIAIIPCEDTIPSKGWRPKASSNLILAVEDFLQRCVSSCATMIDVINPEYEELMIRCRVTFKRRFSSGASRQRLKALCDRMIAPWQADRKTPRFDYSLIVKSVLETIRKQEYIREVSEFSVIRLAERDVEYYVINEYKDENDIIRPSVPYAIFVPAREHLFLYETEGGFGVNEMTIDDTFVVS